MIKYDSQSPYIASYLVLRREGKIAFLMRSNTKWMNGYYSLPSGKVEKKESFSVAAAREGLEEIGVTIDPSKLEFIHTMHRFTQSEQSEWIDVFFQTDDYEGELYNAEPEVHAELAWLDPKNLPENVIPSVKFALNQIEAGKTYSEYGWPVTTS